MVDGNKGESMTWTQEPVITTVPAVYYDFCDCVIHQPSTSELTPKHRSTFNPHAEEGKGGYFKPVNDALSDRPDGLLSAEGVQKLRSKYGGPNLDSDYSGLEKWGPPPLTPQEKHNIENRIAPGDHSPLLQQRRLVFQTYPTIVSGDYHHNGKKSAEFVCFKLSANPQEDGNVIQAFENHRLYDAAIAIIAVGVEATPSRWPAFLQVLDWRWSKVGAHGWKGRRLPAFSLRRLTLRHCPNVDASCLGPGFLDAGSCQGLQEMDASHVAVENMTTPHIIPPHIRALSVSYAQLREVDKSLLPGTLEELDVTYNFIVTDIGTRKWHVLLDDTRLRRCDVAMMNAMFSDTRKVAVKIEEESLIRRVTSVYVSAVPSGISVNETSIFSDAHKILRSIYPTRGIVERLREIFRCCLCGSCSKERNKPADHIFENVFKDGMSFTKREHDDMRTLLRYSWRLVTMTTNKQKKQRINAVRKVVDTYANSANDVERKKQAYLDLLEYSSEWARASGRFPISTMVSPCQALSNVIGRLNADAVRGKISTREELLKEVESTCEEFTTIPWVTRSIEQSIRKKND